MATLVPVDHDPFERLVPVEHDPFAEQPAPQSYARTLMDWTTGNLLQRGPGIPQRGDEFTHWPINPGGELDQNIRALSAQRGESVTSPGAQFDAAMAIMGGPRLGRLPSGVAPIRAYHGSPYDFDRFDISKIGTGEGAQSYGHGLYFAENPSVAQSYRDALGRKGIDWATPEAAEKYDPFTLTAIQREFQKGNSADDIMKMYAQYSRAKQEGRPNLMGDMHDALASGDVRRGRMYEVNINARPEQFLDWDKPLSAQPNAAIDYAKEQWYGDPSPLLTGKDIYQSAGFKNPADTTAVFREAGIPGIRYLDQGSRQVTPQYIADLERRATAFRERLTNEPDMHPDLRANLEKRVGEIAAEIAQKPTSNYVIFDPGIIDIMRKYALPGIATGAAAYSSTDPDSTVRQ